MRTKYNYGDIRNGFEVLPPEKRKWILLLSDDLRLTSGISTMSKELVIGSVHRFNWIQVGAGVNHPETGKLIDLNGDVSNISGVPNCHVTVIPNNGYGNMNLLRELFLTYKFDGILHFTDPHYWEWLYNAEHELRQQLPLLFYHVWDNIDYPMYNRNYYESCDWIGCISKLTYGVVHNVNSRNPSKMAKALNSEQIDYCPHGINPDVFKPVKIINNPVADNYDFILLYNNRNIRRKQTSDVILSYKLFCDMLPKEKSAKCLLLMHTHPIDENGTDLPAVIDVVCPDYDISFSNLVLSQEKINELYNIADCTINIANNEGFGLGSAESLMAGTPIIVNVTGGLQDQCGFDFTADDYINIGSLHKKKIHGDLPHGEWVVPVWSSVHSINGSISTPYIIEDRVNCDDVANAIMTVYNWGKDERQRRGLLGREFMLKNLSSEIMCNSIINGIEKTIDNFQPKTKYELYKIV